MTSYTEVLPCRTCSKHSTIRWTPVEGDKEAGVLVIDTDSARVAYTIEEFSTGWTGRGFTVRKLTCGTDETESNYSVFCNPARPAATSCDCKGHTRFDHCKHADAIAALIVNGWL